MSGVPELFREAECVRFTRSDETLRRERRRSRNLSRVDFDRLTLEPSDSRDKSRSPSCSPSPLRRTSERGIITSRKRGSREYLLDVPRVRVSSHLGNMRRKSGIKPTNSLKDIFNVSIDEEPSPRRLISSSKVGYDYRGRFFAHRRSGSPTRNGNLNLSAIASQLSNEASFSDSDYDSEVSDDELDSNLGRMSFSREGLKRSQREGKSSERDSSPVGRGRRGGRRGRSQLFGRSRSPSPMGRDLSPLGGRGRHPLRRSMRDVFERSEEEEEDRNLNLRLPSRDLECVNFGRRDEDYRSTSRRTPLSSVFN